MSVTNLYAISVFLTLFSFTAHYLFYLLFFLYRDDVRQHHVSLPPLERCTYIFVNKILREYSNLSAVAKAYTVQCTCIIIDTKQSQRLLHSVHDIVIHTRRTRIPLHYAERRHNMMGRDGSWGGTCLVVWWWWW